MRTQLWFPGLACLLFVTLGVPAPVDADSVALGTTSLSPIGQPAVEQDQAVAQQFTLTSSLNVSSLDVTINSDGGVLTSPLLVWITDSLGPSTTASNVLFKASAGPGPFSNSDVNIPVGQTFSTGTYYLLLSTESNLPSASWGLAQSTLASSVGTVGEAFYCCFPSATDTGSFPPSQTYFQLFNLDNQPGLMLFDLRTAAVSTPEPASFVLLGLGLLALICVRERLRTASKFFGNSSPDLLLR